MKKCHGKFGWVEEFNFKFEYDAMLVDHLSNWVDFAVPSRAKSIAIYLCPVNKRRTDVDRNIFIHLIFPFHLLEYP